MMPDVAMAGGTKTVTVIGAGPAGLIAAERAAASGATVTIFDRMPSPARKFLLAGRGGLNLTHSEPPAEFLARYGAIADVLRDALAQFDSEALRAWCADLGVETFVGSSGRVFPRSFKTSPLLRAWLRRLDAAGVTLRVRHRWLGWTDEGASRFATPDGEAVVAADATILALGGASWPQLGSDGSWTGTLAEAGADVAPLEPANCGIRVAWSDVFRERFHGEPLKNLAISFAGQRQRGDVTITRDGLEGGPVYALAPHLRPAFTSGRATVVISLRPDLSREDLVARLAKRQAKQSFSTALRKALALSPAAIALLRETRGEHDPDPRTLSDEALAGLINAVPVHATGAMPIARAISSAGGVRFQTLDENLMLRARPGAFVAGEMLDWEAPTGGYLLQASFATGAMAGDAAVRWLERRG